MSHISAIVQMLARGGPVMIPLVICSVVALAVADVMDATRLAGVGKLAIAVTPRETPR